MSASPNCKECINQKTEGMFNTPHPLKESRLQFKLMLSLVLIIDTHSDRLNSKIFLHLLFTAYVHCHLGLP